MAAITTVITGATSGIGKATAFALARKEQALYLLVRDIIKGDKLVNQIMAETGNKEIYCIKCDLADLYSVYVAAEKLKSKLFAINILINNAGGIVPSRQITKEGNELTFSINHLGHFALTKYLMPLLIKGQARIINVSSEAHKIGKTNFDDLKREKKYSAWQAYASAKMYNILFTRHLKEKYADMGITAFALHPGLVSSGFGNSMSGFSSLLLNALRPLMITPEQGAETIVYLATQPTMHTHSGNYFKRKKIAKISSAANNRENGEKLWTISEDLLAESEANFVNQPVFNGVK